VKVKPHMTKKRGVNRRSDKLRTIVHEFDRSPSCRLQETRRSGVHFEQQVVVELKAVDCLHPVRLAQVITYLKLTQCPAGLLMNFNSISLRAGLRRLHHPELFRRRASHD
jgi:GxxExxY protein